MLLHYNKQGSQHQPLRAQNSWKGGKYNNVRLLISSYPKCKDLFGRGKTTKKEVFNKICAEFNAISDHKVTVEQCMHKWVKLEIKQKEINNGDNNG